MHLLQFTVTGVDEESNETNLLEVQALSDVPKPESTPFPEGHAVHLVNSLFASLQWSAGQF